MINLEKFHKFNININWEYILKSNIIILIKFSIEIKKFDKNRYLNNIERRKNYFTKKNISKWAKVKSPSPVLSPIFLVGFPRSGTTLLDTILRSHPKIKVIEEKPMVLKMVDKIKNKDLKLKKIFMYKYFQVFI